MEQHQATSSVSRNTPFLNTKFLFACILFPLAMLAFSVISVFRSGINWENILFPFLAVVFSAYAWYQGKASSCWSESDL